MNSYPQILIGWASADITPERPALLAGQFHARVSEGVMDPVTATALALSSGEPSLSNAAVMVSCDLVAISPALLSAVRSLVQASLPELDPGCVSLNATHTHTAPEMRVEEDRRATGGGIPPDDLGIDLPALSPETYAAFAAQRIARAVIAAWRARRPGAISYGLGQAVIGRNRRSAYADGESRMYGDTRDPGFRQIEGWEDHSVNLLATWNSAGALTGLMVNVACPSQVSENEYQLSADYWHDTRQELRRRLGPDLFILPQCSAAGDQSPHIQIGAAAEERMWRLAGRTQRQEIAVRIADAVSAVLPQITAERFETPCFAHHTGTLDLSRRLLSAEDVREALAEADLMHAQYEALRRDLDEHPEKQAEPRWYVTVTHCYRRMKWFEGVRDRAELERIQPRIPVEAHLLRLGEVVVATNPFEYYLDFGAQIKARSRALQTFVVQLAGSGGYVPTARAIAGRSYGAVPASTPVGPEGGQELVEWTVAAIERLWTQQD